MNRQLPLLVSAKRAEEDTDTIAGRVRAARAARSRLLEPQDAAGLALVHAAGADASLNEAKERIRSAAQNSGIPLSRRKTTASLIPASLPKRGSGFDLAIV